MPLAFNLRSAGKGDFAFCWPIYSDAVQPLMVAPLEWREPDQRRIVERALTHTGSSILRWDDSDAGWLHVEEARQIIQLKHLFLAPAMRSRGLGTTFLGWMKERADRKRKDLTAELLPDSRARHLFERLGFKAMAPAGHTVTMRY